MTYSLLKLTHLIGLALMSAGLIGVFVSDLRSRQLQDLILPPSRSHYLDPHSTARLSVILSFAAISVEKKVFK